MEIKQKDEGASLVDFVSALKAYFLKTEVSLPTADDYHNFFLKELKE